MFSSNGIADTLCIVRLSALKFFFSTCVVIKDRCEVCLLNLHAANFLHLVGKIALYVYGLYPQDGVSRFELTVFNL